MSDGGPSAALIGRRHQRIQLRLAALHLLDDVGEVVVQTRQVYDRAEKRHAASLARLVILPTELDDVAFQGDVLQVDPILVV